MRISLMVSQGDPAAPCQSIRNIIIYKLIFPERDSLYALSPA